MAPAASRFPKPGLFALGALAPLLALVLPACATPLAGTARSAGPEPDEVPGVGASDDACDASEEGDCSLSLRQLRGQKLLGQEGLEAGGTQGAAAEVETAADEGVRESRLTAEDRARMPMGGPPKTAVQYNGQAWPTLKYHGKQPMHVFAIGDWGGMDGAFVPQERPRLALYNGGKDPGPHTFPRSRPGCNQQALIGCFNHGGNCNPSCGFNVQVDTKAQQLVAEQFNLRGATAKPSYVLNVGDNFYYAGIAQKCGKPMDNVTWVAKRQFEDVFENMYKGPGVDGAVWLSVLGNHDYGGRTFDWGWDAQIAYTWVSSRWIMPALYWSVRVEYPDQDFSVEYWMMDSNAMDAQMSPNEDPDHNICSWHNEASANCAATGGPASTGACARWFWDMWAKQQTWVEKGLAASTADWQVISTHFPCGFQGRWFTKLYKVLGLDLLVTGHRHQQELWPQSPQLGGLTCFVTGGGGGITSEKSPNIYHNQYGFFDLTLTKDTITVESVNYDGKVNMQTTVQKRAKADPMVALLETDAHGADDFPPEDAHVR